MAPCLWMNAERSNGRGYEKQKPGLESEARAASKARPGLAPKARPLHSATGPESEAISEDRGGLESEAISRLTTRGGAGGRLVKKEQGKVPWSTPILEPLPGDYDRATLANADIF